LIIYTHYDPDIILTLYVYIYVFFFFKFFTILNMASIRFPRIGPRAGLDVVEKKNIF
jgi:hypothetical protein